MNDVILYVDDDASNLVVFEAALKTEFEIITASNGEQALEILNNREVAVLLVDQRMPGMTGVEVFEATKDLYPDTIRILITAYSDLKDAVAAINRGQIRRYLRKPWDPEELKAVMRESLEVYQTRRKIRDLETRLLDTERTYALGVVAAGVAHELRNPLSAVLMNADLARAHIETIAHDPGGSEEDQGGNLEAARNALQQVKDAAKNAEQIIKGIELSHKRRDEETTADLKEIVELTLKFVRSAVLKRANLSVDVSAVPRVQGSPAGLSQVITNLLVNAMEALPDRQRHENTISIALGLSEKEEIVRLVVSDNGEGIPGPVIHRIFDPFFTTKNQGGTGLGLAISKKIVEEAGGTLSVEVEPGESTTFTILLPVA